VAISWLHRQRLIVMPENNPLKQLRLRSQPKPRELLANLKDALNQAVQQDVFDRMEHNHNARFLGWDGHDRSCRKPDGTEARPFLPGQKPNDVFPWPGAADLEVRLVDEIIQEANDLLVIAARDGQTSIVPSGNDVTNDRRMQLAEAWGGVSEYYAELSEYGYRHAQSQWADLAWEYGHAILYTGWETEVGIQDKEISEDELAQVFVAAALAQAESVEQMTAAAEGREPVPMEEDQMLEVEMSALADWEMMLLDEGMQSQLVAKLMEYDPELEFSEARRVAKDLKRGGPVTYYVPQVQQRLPDIRALTPGVDVFYPVDTRRIQQAPFIVMADWWTEVELRAKVESDGWNEKAVEDLIAKGATTSRADLGLIDAYEWVLTGTRVGLDVLRAVRNGTDTAQRWQILTVYYRSSAVGGVPAIYKTVIGAEETERPLKHECCEFHHGRFPFSDYLRETRAPCLWDSRGVGELSFSEQEELRIQANLKADNASLTIAPPMEVPSGQELKLVRPRAQFQMRRAGDSQIRKLDMGGDMRGSMEVEKSVLERSNRYWARGNDVDPIVKSNRQKRMVQDWLLSVKQAEKLRFQTIQQFADEIIKANALNGREADLNLHREDIQGAFSLSIDFDVGTLDPKTVEQRMKMLREYVMAMNSEGLLKMEPLLRLATMMINPAWGKLLVNSSEKAELQDAEDITSILSAALNGIEKPYLAGKNHQARAQMIEQLVNMPAMDDQGNPLTDPQTGQPVPGRIARIMQENPDAAALVMNRLKFEQMQAMQLENADIGRKGVKPTQPGGQY
jgi:hypothetical protein